MCRIIPDPTKPCWRLTHHVGTFAWLLNFKYESESQSLYSGSNTALFTSVRYVWLAAAPNPVEH